MEPTTNQPVQESNNQQTTPSDSTVNINIPLVQAGSAVPQSESTNVFIRFFDAHPRWSVITLMIVLGSIGPVLTSLFSNVSALRSRIEFIAPVISSSSLIIIILLMLTNYRGKGKDVLTTMVIIFCIQLCIGLVGLGLCIAAAKSHH